MRDHFAQRSLGDRGAHRNVRSRFRTIDSARKLVVEPLATVGLGLCSTAIFDVSYDFLFTALELSALNPWLVRTVKELDCTVTDCGSHVKRVLTRSDPLILTLAFSFFWEGARRDVEGEEKSCRPPLSISHVPLLTLPTDFSFTEHDNLTWRPKKKKRNWSGTRL